MGNKRVSILPVCVSITALLSMALMLLCINVVAALKAGYRAGGDVGLGQARGDQEVMQLLAILRNEHLRTSEPERVVEAIQRLGELKDPVSIDDLVQLLTFKRTFEQEKGNLDVINEIHLITPQGRYPATEALIAIGKPSLPALLKVVETEKSRSLASQNAVSSIMAIFREEPLKGVQYLQDAAAKSPSLEASSRFLEAAEYARKFAHN